ncbi:MAG: ferredoxin [Anaerolineae bacterium]|nr:MAG: ferredoxin [Anaerolineae bacterium]
MNHTVTFTLPNTLQPLSATVPTGALLTDAAHQAGVEIGQPCGGQGRCGRCAVQVLQGKVRRRSTLRLSPEALAQGLALACQSVVEEDVAVFVPQQEKLERNLTTDRIASAVQVPEGYAFAWSQSIRRVAVTLSPPSMDDQTDDWSRLQTALRSRHKLEKVTVSLSLLRRLGERLRANDWQVSVIYNQADPSHILDVRPLEDPNAPLYAAAIDIGTTTITFWLVDLITGQVVAQAAEYNGQIARGEDVISRIIYASKNGGQEELQARVVETINHLCEIACKRVHAHPQEIIKAAIAGNSTMIHLLLGIPATSIRLSPFITTVNHPPAVAAHEIGLHFCPDAVIDCLPGVASYVGADITAGVLASGLDTTEDIALFIDVGTNGEIVLGNRDWLVACACSAGPAFEGAGVVHGMRATTGAIEEVWIDGQTYEPTVRVIGGGRPRGICGSGLIALIAEMFVTGILDKAGNLNLTVPTKRVRQGEHGSEYVVAWADETETGHDIVITRVDIDNLLRAKAAIYAGFTVLAEQVGLTLKEVQHMIIGGSFGQYLNIEKAIQIGLLPDLPWEKFKFLGNTSIKGTYLALLDAEQRTRIAEIARRMTYIELSADNTFYEAFTSALFLPHTDLSRFPSVETALVK